MLDLDKVITLVKDDVLDMVKIILANHNEEITDKDIEHLERMLRYFIIG
jgi:hypothetical protein